MRYRKDIDGLRAVAVLSVILFHFGYLAHGYLGVDVFFVISGYLITGIIYDELLSGDFSLARFYLRRTRRIIPLALFVTVVSFAIGRQLMLPDDLENLAESVVATNSFGNNILQAVTTRNYWDVANEYKPLVHTWTLGVEEQYYFFYPILLLALRKNVRALLPGVLVALTAASLALNLVHFPDFQKFFYLPFRFYELSLGGLGAIYFRDRRLRPRVSPFLVAALLCALCIPLPFVSAKVLIPASVLLTLGILVSANDTSTVAALALENPLLVGVGQISFGLYLWHQVILAYARYAFAALTPSRLAVIFVLTLLLSVATYRFVEQPFRRRETVSTRTLLAAVSTVWALSTALALVTYLRAGVLHDVPELDIVAAHVQQGMHAAYNHRIYEYDRAFPGTDKVKVLVVGNSFGRDWTNVLLESKYAANIAISYTDDPNSCPDFTRRAKEADVIFYSETPRSTVRLADDLVAKLWVVGTKNFGVSNGAIYNHRGGDYFAQRARLGHDVLAQNEALKRDWGGRYVDLIGKIVAGDETVPVFTPSEKFISQDCRHLTRAGAEYFAQLFDAELGSILRRAGS
ncbi:MAG TPA: acyltransferase [Polyangiaceae bacterium]|jgi:peptidoglycan/LPS O-acetylase OafA/YrhL|nr:acyltransferase [Polyangiaceae bacterium]